MEINLDEVLSKKSEALFEIDDSSRQILSLIAKNGPMTIYKMAEERGISRPKIYRRMKGEGGYIGLLDHDYLEIEREEAFPRIKGLTKKLYGLTCKGMVASLSNIKFEEVYLCKEFLQDIHQRSERKEFSEIIKNYLKAELAWWLQLHQENGLSLTNVKDFETYYLGSRTYLCYTEKKVAKISGRKVEIVDVYSKDYRIIEREQREWARKLLESLRQFPSNPQQKLFNEIGEWMRYMRLLHGLKEKDVGALLEHRSRETGFPVAGHGFAYTPDLVRHRIGLSYNEIIALERARKKEGLDKNGMLRKLILEALKKREEISTRKK